jgi:hypothetical protein
VKVQRIHCRFFTFSVVTLNFNKREEQKKNFV